MNILILTSNNLYGCFIINKLAPYLEGHGINVLLTSDTKIHHNHLKPLSTFENHLLSLLLENELRDFHRQKLNGLRIIEPDIKDSESSYLLRMIKETAPDLILSCANSSLILKNEMIALPKYGVINLHPGALPKYRGLMASFWPMLNGESYQGACLHYIEDNTIDTGSIINQNKIVLHKTKSYLYNRLNAIHIGAAMIVNTLTLLSDNTPLLMSTAQRGDANYHTWPKKSDLINFEQKGYKLFDINEFDSIKKLCLKKLIE